MSPITTNTIAFLKTGNRKAFEFLYLDSLDEIKRYATFLTGGRYAEDLIQVTCLQVLQYDGKNKDPAKFNFRAFFCRSLHNTFVSQYRTKKPGHLDIDEFSMAGPDYGKYTEKNYEPLLRCIEALLTEDQKEVIYLRMKGVMFKDIARILDINPNTATGSFRYSRMKLAPYKKEILDL